MKQNICILFLFICFTSFAQKRKEIKKFNIRSVSCTETIAGKTVNDTRELYDAEGNLITEFNYHKDGSLKSTIQYKYKNGKDLYEEVKYDSLYHVAEKKLYKYNALGYKTEELVTNKDGNILKTIKYLYNRNGLKSERRTYDAAGKLISTKKYTYNGKP